MKLLTGIVFPLAAAAAATLASVRQDGASSSASNITITSNKVERSFLLWVSPKYNSKNPATVILSYHGGNKNANDQLELDGFTKANANAASIVVYPQGINVSCPEFPIQETALLMTRRRTSGRVCLETLSMT